MKQLPKQGWGILCSKESMEHPMWVEFISHINKLNGLSIGFEGTDTDSFYGVREDGRGDCSLEWESFGFHAEIITIEQWAEATRCKSVDPVFDPELSFEVSNNNVDWYHPDGYYLAFDDKFKHHVICQNSKYVSYPFVRNVQPFTASMLEVGEYMETEPRLGDTQLIKRISLMNWIEYKTGQGTFGEDLASEIKGRRVDVDLIVREV
jgi:hypothetical protein